MTRCVDTDYLPARTALGAAAILPCDAQAHYYVAIPTHLQPIHINLCRRHALHQLMWREETAPREWLFGIPSSITPIEDEP